MNKNPFKLEEGHVVHKAFKSGNVQYYYIKDTFNTFALRAMDALAIYEQWEMRCTKEYLYAHAMAVDAALNKGMLTEVASLNNNLKERQAFAIPTEDIIYQFASIVYFDENESPYRYDPEYGKEKIARWKKDMKISEFFFHQPIKELIPSPILSGKDSEVYLRVTNAISQKHLKQISDLILPQAQNKDFYQALLYQKSLQQIPAV